jgi:hypothetical protein
MDGRNFAAVNSATIDGLLDDLALAGHANNARINAASAAHSQILGEVAVSNLVTPMWHIGVSKCLSEYDPWGADYYVIRADFHNKAMCKVRTPAAPTPATAKPPATDAPTTAPTAAPTTTAAAPSGDNQDTVASTDDSTANGAVRAALGCLSLGSLLLLA